MGFASPTLARELAQNSQSLTFPVSRSFQLDESNTASPIHSQQPNNRSLNESRKLLAHLLEQLQNRPMPPSLYDAFQARVDGSIGKGFGVIVDTVRGAVKFKAALQRNDVRTQSTFVAELEDEDEETDNSFTTNATFDLLLQLRLVLILSVAQGLQIFQDRYECLDFTLVEHSSYRCCLVPLSKKVIAVLNLSGGYHRLSVDQEAAYSRPADVLVPPLQVREGRCELPNCWHVVSRSLRPSCPRTAALRYPRPVSQNLQMLYKH